MFGLDEQLAALADGETLLVVLAVALLLGLRHASDPDHLAAVSTLIASEPANGTQRGGPARARLGARPRGDARAIRPADRALRRLPARPRSSSAAEALVGLMIMFLAARLLLRWRRGQLPRALRIATGTSSTGTCTRTTARPPATSTATSRRPAWDALRRRLSVSASSTGWAGRPGSAVLLLATIPDQAEAVAGLIVLALGTAASMAALSSAFGYAITRGPVLRRDARVRAGHGSR